MYVQPVFLGVPDLKERAVEISLPNLLEKHRLGLNKHVIAEKSLVV